MKASSVENGQPVVTTNMCTLGSEHPRHSKEWDSKRPTCRCILQSTGTAAQANSTFTDQLRSAARLDLHGITYDEPDSLPIQSQVASKVGTTANHTGSSWQSEAGPE